MQRQLVIASLCVLLAGTFALSIAQDPVPSDPQASCTVKPAEFDKWFASGMAAPNGIVLPADSVNFTPDSLCSFYKWSWQMFLWMNSTTKTGLVVDSAQFFEVGGFDGTARHFISNVSRGKRVRSFGVFHAQGKKGTGVVVDSKGKIETPEFGQANTNGVLISQKGSLVYYGISTNDVFAQFLTGVKTGKIAATQFPSSQAELDKVSAFAFPPPSTGIFKDASALVIEVKTSWVEASTVDDSTRYITITGLVPDFDKTNPAKWVAKGSKQVKLAMVGMHVVGTVKGHPEMIWATFEHVDNAPNDTFSYQNDNGAETKVTFDSTAASVFCAANTPMPASGANAPPVAKVSLTDGSIVGVNGGKIGPANTIRFSPWGQDSSAPDIANNTQIISVNKSVRGLLGNSDVRRNYFLVGTTWTNGAIPGVDNNVPTIGSQQLANSTMETYSSRTNCFSCHANDRLGIGGGRSADGLSHIYGDLQPLP
jgi:hypothetical protein